MASNLLELMRVINDVIRLLGSPSFPSLPGDFTFQPTERQIDTSRILCRLCGAHLLMDQTPESAQHQILRKKSTKGIRFCGEMGSMGDEPGWNVELGGGQYKSRSLSLSLSSIVHVHLDVSLFDKTTRYLLPQARISVLQSSAHRHSMRFSYKWSVVRLVRSKVQRPQPIGCLTLDRVPLYPKLCSRSF